MRYCGIQPQYFPRLHYFARIINTDIFMLRDDAQYVGKHKYPNGKTGKSYQAHSPIKQSLGSNYLIVPVQHGGFTPLCHTKISYSQTWVTDHLKTLQMAYGRAPFYTTLRPEIEWLLQRNFQTLAGLNIATVIWGLLYLLDEKTPTQEKLSVELANEILKNNTKFRLKQIKKASESKAMRNDKLTTNEKIVALCREIGATEDYCGGTGVSAYVDTDLFSKNGIKITIQDWTCIEYPQLFKKQQGFLANLSILDLLFNVSRTDALTILLG